MPAMRCSSCQLPLTEAEWKLGKCPVCGEALAAAATSAPPPAAAKAESRGQGLEWITWTLFGVGFVAVAILIWLARTPVQDTALLAQMERLEERLQQLENLAKTNLAKTPTTDKTLLTRLDQLDEKMAESFKAAAPRAADIKEQSQQLARLEAKLEALSQRSFAPPTPPGPLQIRVISKDWGDADPDNLHAVCLSAASEIWQFVPDRRLEPITVNRSTGDPMVIFGRGPDGERRVKLNVKGKHWAQCAYQFSHEFCHILCNYREAKNPNLWFEEALCETASLFALRRMAETWKTKPPYPNWKSYAGALADYADNTARDAPALGGLTLAEWFTKNEPVLRSDGTNRQRIRLVALAMLKVLEKNPHHWQAVGYLNQWEAKDPNLTFTAYLNDWYQRVPAVHKPFVREIGALVSIDVK